VARWFKCTSRCGGRSPPACSLCACGRCLGLPSAPARSNSGRDASAGTGRSEWHRCSHGGRRVAAAGVECSSAPAGSHHLRQHFHSDVLEATHPVVIGEEPIALRFHRRGKVWRVAELEVVRGPNVERPHRVALAITQFSSAGSRQPFARHSCRTLIHAKVDTLLHPSYHWPRANASHSNRLVRPGTFLGQSLPGTLLPVSSLGAGADHQRR
jgi:hypothetical protein